MRKNSVSFIFAILCSMLLMISSVQAGGHGHDKPVKKGILLVAFGSSIPEAQVSFENIEKKVRATFPDTPVHWAYTSSIIRHKLAKEGKQLDSVAVALAKMMDQEYTHVAVQSLHTIGGEEFHDLLQTVHAFRGMANGFSRILVGYPLLSTEADMVSVTKAILGNLPKDRKKGDAVVLMGHGTPHPSNAFYVALMYHLQRKDPNIFVGTVEGAPGIDDIREILVEKKAKKAYLIPFMSVAGDHARNDMAGDEEDSWKSVLTKAGVTCVPVLKGTAEYENMVDIWVAHLKVVLDHFK